MREKHQDWEALLESALAEECSAPANLLELVRQENRAAVLTRNSSLTGWSVSFHFFSLVYVCVCAQIKHWLIHLTKMHNTANKPVEVKGTSVPVTPQMVNTINKLQLTLEKHQVDSLYPQVLRNFNSESAVLTHAAVLPYFTVYYYSFCLYLLSASACAVSPPKARSEKCFFWLAHPTKQICSTQLSALASRRLDS